MGGSKGGGKKGGGGGVKVKEEAEVRAVSGQYNTRLKDALELNLTSPMA